MHKGKYVFSQLLDFLDRNDFNYLARKYGGDKYVKQFTCYNQLCVLMFGQLSNRESLRDVVLATQAHASKAYHLGFGKHAAKSTLADANTKRDYRIFEEFAYKVIAEAQRCRIVDIFKLNGNVYAFDSTYASTFPHCSMKSSEYLWPKTKRLVKEERRSKSKLRVCA